MGASSTARALPSGAFSATPGPFAPGSGAAAVYRRPEPAATSLYPIVQHHLGSFLAHAEARGDAVPDQTPAFDPFERDPIPDFDFDPTHGA